MGVSHIFLNPFGTLGASVTKFERSECSAIFRGFTAGITFDSQKIGMKIMKIMVVESEGWDLFGFAYVTWRMVDGSPMVQHFEIGSTLDLSGRSLRINSSGLQIDM
nr:uncharacterized protein LOC114823145 [Malus domestica]